MRAIAIFSAIALITATGIIRADDAASTNAASTNALSSPPTVLPANAVVTKTTLPKPFVPGSETTPEGCTLETFYVHSPSMGRDIRACVVLPPEYAAHPDKKYPVLYALHGSAAPFDAFAAMIPLKKALAGKPMIVACFDADANSMYLDAIQPVPTGRAYGPTGPVKSLFTTFFLKEFIPGLDKRYRIDPRKRMLTGFSMGGYGAFHYMLDAPGEFVAVSTMSGYFPDYSKPPKDDWLVPILGPYADNRQAYLDVDPHEQIRQQLAAGKKLPPIYMTCGAQDRLLWSSKEMHAFLTGLGVPVDYHDEDPGEHNWPYWRDHSAQIIDFHWNAVRQK